MIATSLLNLLTIAGVVAGGITFLMIIFLFTTLLLISISGCNIDLSLHLLKLTQQPDRHILQPVRCRRFYHGQRRLQSTGVHVKLPIAQTPVEGVLPETASSVLSVPVDGRADRDSLRMSGGRLNVADDFLRPVLDLVHKSVEDVFPPNKIFTKCAGCGSPIPRFQGYSQRVIGDRGTLCLDCQRGRGLPVRDLEA